MEFFKSIISFLAYASLGFSAVAAYLKINKIWKRKHNAEVAASVSIVGNFVDIVPLSIFGMNYLLVAQWQGLIDSAIWIVAGVVLILIGSGFWVEIDREQSLWQRMKAALKLEKSEVGHLATSFLRPSGAEIILEILTNFAYVDRKLAATEKDMIESFARHWHLKIDWDELQNLADIEQPVSLVQTRETVERYLKTSPPKDQVAQLTDVLGALVKIDDTVTDQESLILDEVRALLRNYVGGSDAEAQFTVVIAPQNRDQDTAISALFPNVEKREIAGGSGYLVGSYYTQEYADVICDQYRALGFFTIEMIPESPVVA